MYEDAHLRFSNLLTSQEVMAAKEALGIERAYGNIYFAQGGFIARADYLTFTESQDVANHTLAQAHLYSDIVAHALGSGVSWFYNAKCLHLKLPMIVFEHYL